MCLVEYWYYQELQTKLHCTAEDRAKASEEVALEMVKHLKRLTDHMRELESTVNSAEQHLSTNSNYRVGSSNAKANKSTTTECNNYYSYASEENLSGGLLLDNNNQTCVADQQNIRGGQRHVYFSSLHDVRTTNIAHHEASSAQIMVIDKLKRWITWKWRWAASSARYLVSSLIRPFTCCPSDHNITQGSFALQRWSWSWWWLW